MKILAIDTYNMIHRARHGFNFGDNHITFGFFRCLKSEIKRHKPDIVYIVSEGRPIHRYKISSSYKATRPKDVDTDFLRQKDDIFNICRFLPIRFIRHPDYECDDVIAMLCTKSHIDDEVTICSSDSDFIQLLEYSNVKLWNPIKKIFVEKWPVDYCMWKSLKGDPSDNISGVKGVGEKTAMKLSSSREALNEFFDKKPYAESEFIESMSLIEFADIDPRDSRLEFCAYNFNEVDLYDSFEDRSFKSIVGKSWGSWKDTMELLDENVESTNFSRSN